jgi:hypothetical protein
VELFLVGRLRLFWVKDRVPTAAHGYIYLKKRLVWIVTIIDPTQTSVHLTVTRNIFNVFISFACHYTLSKYYYNNFLLFAIKKE